MLLRLTQPGEGTEDTRRRATLAELLPAEGEPADVETAVRELADARLLTTGKDERGDEIVDVSHEALIRGWPRLREWIDEDRAGLRTHRRLTEAANVWSNKDQDESFLYRGARLTEAAEWADAHADDLNPLEREFLEASVGAREAERIAARQRVQRVIVGLVIGLVIISALAIFAWGRSQLAEQRRVDADNAKATAQAESTRAINAESIAQAERATAQAESTRAITAEATAQAEAAVALSRQLAAQAVNELDKPNYELALLLAIEAGRKADTAEAFAVLRQAFAHPGRTLVILSHEGLVNQAQWNADESHILTAGCDRRDDLGLCEEGTARVWDAETGAELLTLSHGDAIYQAQWNADESRILTASEDGTVRQWYTQMEDLLEAACQRAPRNMTGVEWRRLMRSDPYRQTCPRLPPGD